jgi:hypothetical protein
MTFQDGQSEQVDGLGLQQVTLMLGLIVAVGAAVMMGLLDTGPSTGVTAARQTETAAHEQAEHVFVLVNTAAEAALIARALDAVNVGRGDSVVEVRGIETPEQEALFGDFVARRTENTSAADVELRLVDLRTKVQPSIATPTPVLMIVGSRAEADALAAAMASFAMLYVEAEVQLRNTLILVADPEDLEIPLLIHASFENSHSGTFDIYDLRVD